jgi:hypothetical protein
MELCSQLVFTLTLSCHLRLKLPCGLLPAVFRPKYCTRATCPAYRNLLNTITLIVCDVKYQFEALHWSIVKGAVATSYLKANIEIQGK